MNLGGIARAVVLSAPSSAEAGLVEQLAKTGTSLSGLTKPPVGSCTTSGAGSRTTCTSAGVVACTENRFAGGQLTKCAVQVRGTQVVECSHGSGPGGYRENRCYTSGAGCDDSFFSTYPGGLRNHHCEVGSLRIPIPDGL